MIAQRQRSIDAIGDEQREQLAQLVDVLRSLRRLIRRHSLSLVLRSLYHG
jgi:hypothetical protein